MGIVRAANVVDHVFPWRSIGAHAFRANRWQSLCAECHSVKTASEQRGQCIEFGHRVWALSDYPGHD
jgi:5-methylcytosine-specific restriction endonuclease McrA